MWITDNRKKKEEDIYHEINTGWTVSYTHLGIAACGNQSESNKDDNTITVWCWDKTFNIFAMEEAAKIYQEDHQRCV